MQCLESHRKAGTYTKQTACVISERDPGVHTKLAHWIEKQPAASNPPALLPVGALEKTSAEDILQLTQGRPLDICDVDQCGSFTYAHFHWWRQHGIRLIRPGSYIMGSHSCIRALGRLFEHVQYALDNVHDIREDAAHWMLRTYGGRVARYRSKARKQPDFLLRYDGELSDKVLANHLGFRYEPVICDAAIIHMLGYRLALANMATLVPEYVVTYPSTDNTVNGGTTMVLFRLRVVSLEPDNGIWFDTRSAFDWLL